MLAFERFSKLYPDSHAKLYIAAHGTETASIKLQVQQLGISDLVSFTGFVSGEEKPTSSIMLIYISTPLILNPLDWSI